MTHDRIHQRGDAVQFRAALFLVRSRRGTSRRTLAITVAEEDSFPRDRPSALTELVPLLPEDLRAIGVRLALDAVVAVEREGWRAFDVCRLAPYLPAALMPEALTAILTVDCEQWRAEGIAHIAQHLPPDLLDRAADVANAMANPYWQALATAYIAPLLPEDRRRATVAGLPILVGKPSPDNAG